ncbi:MAG: sugar isomerase domain-containing protein [Armatimonadota bacterium]
MVPLQYTAAVRGILEHLETTQMPAIEQAADLVIAALTHGGAVFCSGIGHGNEGDFLNRAGGLAALQRFSFGCNITDPVAECLKDRPRQEPFDRERETVHFAVKASNLRTGDVLLLSSVSGKNKGPIELALACREQGVKTIGFTAMAYTAQVEPIHPSGKKLFEVVDVVIDIGAPYGDAVVDVPGYDYKALPISGVAMTVIGWMLWGRVMEKMAEAGTPPTVFMSINRAGGPEHYEQRVAEYQRRGY